MVIFQYKSSYKMVKFQHVFKQKLRYFNKNMFLFPSIHRSNHPSKEYHRHRPNFYPCHNQRPWDFLHVPYFPKFYFIWPVIKHTYSIKMQLSFSRTSIPYPITYDRVERKLEKEYLQYKAKSPTTIKWGSPYSFYDNGR